jgi:hypothetical protein
MFIGLYHCRSEDGETVCDYVTEGVYFTFTFRNGVLTEHNE